MIKKTLSLTLVALGLAACSAKNQYIMKLSPTTDKREFVIAQKVGISSLSLPNYLLKYPIAKRVGTNEIEYLGNRVWADRLDDALKRELIHYLQGYTTHGGIENYPWGAMPDVSVDVTLNEFIALKNSIVLESTVKFYYKKSGKTLIKQMVIDEPFSGSEGDIAEAMSRAFAKFSYKIGKILAQK